MNTNELTTEEEFAIEDERFMIAIIKKEYKKFEKRLNDIVKNSILDEIKIHIVSDFDWKSYYSSVDNEYSCSINKDAKGFAPYCIIHDHSEFSFKD